MGAHQPVTDQRCWKGVVICLCRMSENFSPYVCMLQTHSSATSSRPSTCTGSEMCACPTPLHSAAFSWLSELLAEFFDSGGGKQNKICGCL